MPPPNLPPREDERVRALRRYGVVDRPPTPDFDALVRLAAHVTGSPTSVINLIDADRQVTYAACGAERGEVPRDDAMCAHAVSEGSSVHVADARADPRFADNPFVTGDLGRIRLYASSPLVTTDGYAIGTLCVVDDRPRSLDDAQRQALDDLSGQVVQLLELHRHTDDLADALARLDHLASHDPLTGLVNRRRFTEQLADHLTGPTGDPAEHLIVYADLDGFKAVNDRHGHHAGDEVLRAVAERMTAQVRPGDLLARMGGDEFALLCRDTPVARAPGLVQRLRDAVARPIELTSGVEVVVGLSLGSARTATGADVDDLLRRADHEMYADKRSRAGTGQDHLRAAARAGPR